MKVFFDIITNHTADVFDYRTPRTTPRAVPTQTKEAEPYRDAAGTPFDDRAFTTIGDPFPAVDPRSRSPTRRRSAPRPTRPPRSRLAQRPTMYHNRGTRPSPARTARYGDFPSGNRRRSTTC